MIYSLTANKDSFHPITFHKGLNLILGVKAAGSGTTDTCNSLGKSTALRIVDFCLGSDVDKEKCLPASKLPGWEFTLDLDVGGSRVKVTRGTDGPDIINVEGDVSMWPVQPGITRIDGVHQYDLELWRKLLGIVFFGLPKELGDVGGLPPPTYRQLFAYVYRKSFESPLKPIGQTSASDRDRSITYLLGLEWEFVSRMSLIDKRKKDAQSVRDAVNVKLREWETKISVVKAECRALESDLKSCKDKLESFNVDPAYHQYEAEASKRTTRIHCLRSQIIADQRNLVAAKSSLDDETSDSEAVIELYENARAVLSDSVKKRLRDVQAFHAEVSNNRKEFLRAEIKRLSKQIRENETESKRLDSERAEYLQHLKTSGALEEFVALQNTYLAKLDSLAAKQLCVEDYEKSKRQLAALAAEKKNAVQESKAEFERREEKADSAEIQFKDIVGKFYNTTGTLGIEFNDGGKKQGYKFAPDVKGNDGAGIGKIAVFAFDMTLFLQSMKSARRNSLLIHDGEIFVSSDDRQSAAALEMAHKFTFENDAQYITGMNEDAVPYSTFSEGFDCNACVALRLQDGTVEGKLLGIDF